MRTVRESRSRAKSRLLNTIDLEFEAQDEVGRRVGGPPSPTGLTHFLHRLAGWAGMRIPGPDPAATRAPVRTRSREGREAPSNKPTHADLAGGSSSARDASKAGPKIMARERQAREDWAPRSRMATLRGLRGFA